MVEDEEKLEKELFPEKEVIAKKLTPIQQKAQDMIKMIHDFYPEIVELQNNLETLTKETESTKFDAKTFIGKYLPNVEKMIPVYQVIKTFEGEWKDLADEWGKNMVSVFHKIDCKQLNDESLIVIDPKEVLDDKKVEFLLERLSNKRFTTLQIEKELVKDLTKGLDPEKFRIVDVKLKDFQKTEKGYSYLRGVKKVETIFGITENTKKGKETVKKIKE